ncbi:hypothetical protein [Synechococcus sp. W70.1]|uniref:hypothetical protein n=1 Tax=Synechococcus sp. W70.1 TaxID=2964534 RepID=UPI0039C2D2AC
MKLFLPLQLSLSLALLLWADAPAQAQQIVIDERGIVVEPSPGGLLIPNQPLFAPIPPGRVPFSIDAEGQVVSAPGYRCSAATAADNSPILCRSQFNPSDVVVYERDGRPNTLFADNLVIRPTGSGLRILPNPGPGQSSGSGLRIILN